LTIVSSISSFLKRDKVQRLFYLLGLIVWFLLLRNEFHKYDKESSLGISYFWLILIPATLLTLQIILNHKILWFIIFGLVLIYSIYSACYTLADTIERSGNHVKAIYWDFETTAILIIIFIMLFLTNWIIFKLKPSRQ
jgi:hypothetical protein